MATLFALILFILPFAIAFFFLKTCIQYIENSNYNRKIEMVFALIGAIFIIAYYCALYSQAYTQAKTVTWNEAPGASAHIGAAIIIGVYSLIMIGLRGAGIPLFIIVPATIIFGVNFL